MLCDFGPKFWKSEKRVDLLFLLAVEELVPKHAH